MNYSTGANQVLQPRNVMSDFNAVANQLPESNQTYQDNLSNNLQMMNVASTGSINDLMYVPAKERAIQESHLAVQREQNKQKKLQDFRRKTKLAAQSYGKSIKSEAQVKQDQEKVDTDAKNRKKKEFEVKLKKMRQTMKVKKSKDGKDNKNDKTTENIKNTVPVKVQGKPSGQYRDQNKENQNSNPRVYNNSIIKRNFGATSI